MAKILDALEDVGAPERTAAFVCAVVYLRHTNATAKLRSTSYSAGQAATEHEPGAARAAPENVHMDDAVPHRPEQRAT